MLIGIISDSPHESSLRNYGVKVVFEDLGLDFSFLTRKDVVKVNLYKYPLIIIILNKLNLSSEFLTLLNDFVKNGGSLIISGIAGNSVEQELLNQLCDVTRSVLGGQEPPHISGWLRPKVNNFLNFSFIDLPIFFKYEIYDVANDSKVIMKQLNVQKEEVGDAIFLIEKGNGIIFRVAFDFFGIIGYLLSGGEWILRDQRQENSLGENERVSWLTRDGILSRAGLIQFPIINEYEKILFNLILWVAMRQGFPILQKMPWPKGKSYAVCLTHDVDAVASSWHSLRLSIRNLCSFKFLEGIPRFFSVMFEFISAIINKYLLPSSKRNTITYIPLRFHNLLKKYNPFWNFDKFMMIERKFGAKSSFYFLDNVSACDSDYSIRDRKIVDVMKKLESLSWEVGVHGVLSSFMNKKMIIYQKKKLEKSIGKTVKGYRQHYLHFNIPESWEQLSEAGYLYDTTFGSSSEVGFLAATCFPFKVFNFLKNKELPLLEIPFMVMDRTLFDEIYMNLTTKEALNVIKKMITIIQRYSGVFVLLWHTCFFNAPIDQQEWFQLYLRILTYVKHKDNSAWITSAKEIAQWWNKRGSLRFEEIELNSTEAVFQLFSDQKVENLTFRIFVPKNKQLKSIKIGTTVISAKYIDSKIDDLNLLIYSIPLTSLKALNTQIRLKYMH